ncbi:MAG: asparagine synthase (glutamine-hydrolyzing) [Acidobacteria bacterium]|nr:asparagine synthase (glutamine-hydrolyzing) [Acidobacteriota bacterium]
MCGICGYITEKGNALREQVQNMAKALRLRGPDDEGYYVNASIALGHRRLSIIDLESGHQPITNENASIWLVFNGEIYNFHPLREQLKTLGHNFATKSDSEVIIHAYEEYGEDCLKYFNGMFAFALWDEEKERLFLARDRFGEKPLYYAHCNGDFCFASEPKALFAHPKVSKELDLRSLSRYLAYEYVPWPHSMFKHIRKLPPAHYLIYEKGEIKISRYWDPQFRSITSTTEEEISEELLKRLKEAVKLRLISDVPLGVFLSGGIDSSAIVAMMAELIPSKQIKTFSIAFEDKSFDESHYARMVANHFDTDHSEHAFNLAALSDVLPEITSYMDEPLGDGSLMATFLLAKFTRQKVTVALGGDGGDELFAGYPTFAAFRVANIYEHVPKPFQAAISWAANLLPVSTDNFSLDFKIKQFLKGARYQNPMRNQAWIGSFTPDEQQELFSSDVNRELAGFNPYSKLTELENEHAQDSPLNRLTYQYFNCYLTDNILFKVDRTSMACSLEARSPFLDHTFAEYVCSLPEYLRLNGLKTKYILKRSLTSKIPSEIINRRKKGFGIPVAKLILGGLREEFKHEFEAEKIKREGFFNPNFTSKLLSDHLEGKKDNRKLLWTLMMFQLWSKNYLST